MARNNTSFRAGQSGNPRGRPKSDFDIETLAKQHTAEAIAALLAALKSPRERVHAAAVLLDRGWGKARQNISGDKDRPLIVDFRWADNTVVSTAIHPVIEAAIEAEAEPSLAWQG